ncbi:MAG: YtxH domain-containing protein [Caldisericia bacterium]|nr:YtxH domain-containing protein [Caldisericia bacterium]
MKNNENRFGLGLFLGIAMGVLAGIVLAPSTGEETRRKILDSTDELQNSIKTISKKIKIETDEMIKKGKDFMQEAENSTANKIKQTSVDSEKEVSNIPEKEDIEKEEE